MTSAGASDVAISHVTHLDHDQIHDVLELIRHVSDVDGVRPISEHVMLHLRHGGDAHDSHVLAYDAHDSLVGYLHLDTTDVVSGASCELAVAPEARRRGVGAALVRTAWDATDLPVRLWAHGTDHGAHGLATAMGFAQVRTLWQMRRSLYAALPQPQWPSGVSVRTFLPGIDDEALLRVNARAFASHPDQGVWTREDLQVRMAETWFDASGLLVACAGNGEIVGFHWTKVHGGHTHSHGSDPAPHTHDPIGEVYVLGVDPDWQGTGLGRALTIAGLALLRSRGLDEAMLYVDADNERAIRTYSALGFTQWDSDVLYRRERG